MKNYLTLLFLMLVVLLHGQDSPGLYTVKNAKINTQSSDFGTAFYGKNKVVFASPKQGFTLNMEENTNQPFLDLYSGEVTEDGQIINKQKLKGEINTKYHEGMVSFTKDMKTVYFTANNYVKKKKKKDKVKSSRFIQIFKASITDEGEWTNLVLLPFNGQNFSSGHPALNWDDTQLYFASDRPESYGKTDIFVVDIYEDGSYSEPRNLGPKINTSEREMFPFVGLDNILYFSSDGYPGHGELDVYASKIFDSTVSEPINLEEPVNSEYDDFAYIIDDRKHRGYFSSNRKGGQGDDDIYSFIASPPIYIECQQEITGVVRDINTQELIPDVLIVLYDEKGSELQSFISSKDEGSFSFQQECAANYTIKGFIEGHLVAELDIQTVNDLNAEPLEIVLEIKTDYKNDADVIADGTGLPESSDEGTKAAEQLEVAGTAKVIESNEQTEMAMEESKNAIASDSQEQVQPADLGEELDQINTIYFDFDKYDIRYDARIELDKIADVLQRNPQTKIKVNAHTDIRGKKEYNLKLSKSRAYQTVKYLVEKGIEDERIASEGHGENEVAEKCTKGVGCTELQHQLNRRSEFLILDRFSDVVIARSLNRSFSGNYALNDRVSNSGAYVNYDFSGNQKVYTVQIGAFKGKVQKNTYSKLKDLFNYRYGDGLNRYYAGLFTSSSEARAYMNQMRKNGFKDAFVVGLQGENRF